VSRLWTGHARGGRLGNAFLATLIRSPLYRLTPFLLFFIAFYFIFVSPRGKRASYELAARLGRGGSPWRRFFFLWRHNYIFGTLLVDRLAIVSGKGNRYRFVRPDPALVDPIREGRGMIFLTAHLGSWDMMGQMLAVERSIAVNLVMHVGVQPEIRAMLERGRQFKVIEADGSPATAAALLDVLGNGEMVAMMGDRIHEGEGIDVEFLGGTIRRFIADPVGELRYTDRRHKQNDHRRWAQAYASRLEALVRKYPFQWGNFYSLWETEE